MALKKSVRVAEPYHHGDLRRALLESALAILAETGRWDFSLREVARRAGVSHNAPYRHFADRQALLQAIAVVGYASLRARGRTAVEGLIAPPSILAALGRSYVKFGVENPALYRLMFGQTLPAPDAQSSLLLDAVVHSRQTLRNVIAAGARDGSFNIAPSDAAAITAAAVSAWSLVHGFTLLTIDGVVQRDTRDENIAGLGVDVVNAFVENLSRTRRTSGAEREGEAAVL